VLLSKKVTKRNCSHAVAVGTYVIVM